MSWLNNISLKAKMGLIIGVGVVGLSVFAWIAYTTLQEVRIGGNKYQQIKRGTQATADIFPPDGNVLMLDWYYRRVVLRVVDGEYDIARMLYQRYKEQRERYNKTAEKWREYPELYRVMPFESPSVKKYIQLLETRFEPAFERGDWKAVTDPKHTTVIAAAIREVDRVYKESIERLAKLQEEEEQHAVAMVHKDTRLMGVVFVGTLLVLIAFSVLIARQIIRTVQATQHAAQQLAQGDLTVQVPVAGKDEMGTLAQSINNAVRALREVLAQANATAEQVASQVNAVVSRFGQVAHGISQAGAAVDESARGVSRIASRSPKRQLHPHPAPASRPRGRPRRPTNRTRLRKRRPPDERGRPRRARGRPRRRTDRASRQHGRREDERHRHKHPPDLRPTSTSPTIRCPRHPSRRTGTQRPPTLPDRDDTA
jgi:HAMP domain-containing protein